MLVRYKPNDNFGRAGAHFGPYYCHVRSLDDNELMLLVDKKERPDHILGPAYVYTVVLSDGTIAHVSAYEIEMEEIPC